MNVLENAPQRCLGFDVAQDSITVFDTAGEQVRVIANRHGARAADHLGAISSRRVTHASCAIRRLDSRGGAFVD